MLFSGKKSKKKGKPKAEKPSFDQIRDEILSEMDNTSESDPLIAFGLAKKFFSKYLKSANLTFEEAADEIEKKKIEPSLKKRTVDFLREVADLEYTPNLSDDRVSQLKDDFRAVLFALTHSAKHIPSKKAKEKKASRSPPSAIKKILTLGSVGKPETEGGIHLRSALEAAHDKMLDGDITAAEGFYLSALNGYKRLLKEEREKYYPSIKALHEMLQKIKSLDTSLVQLMNDIGPVSEHVSKRSLDKLRSKYLDALTIYADLPDHLKQAYYEQLLGLRSKLA